jgi:hypothetical protein
VITIKDWVKHVEDEIPIYYNLGGKIYKESGNIAIAYDKNISTFRILNNVRTPFDEAFLEEKDCAKFLISEITKEYLK